MADKLKRCPFCGGSDIRIEKIYDYYEVLCCDCLSRTEEYSTNEEAIEAWNNRPSPWHTGTPTEDGWYLCERKKYEYRKYFVYRFKDGEWDYFLPENILRWQKIKED